MKQSMHSRDVGETKTKRVVCKLLHMTGKVFCAVSCLHLALHATAQQPSEPIDINPIDGEVYYIVNQLSGLQLDLNDNSISAGSGIVQEARSFTNLSQRWALTKLPGGFWVISNLANGLCMDSSTGSGMTLTVQNPCMSTNPTQEWSVGSAANGYTTLLNEGTGLVLDISGGSQSAGASIDQSPASLTPTQSQQWLLRPAFFRGVDSALLEKQEAERIVQGYPWWQDAGQPQDVLELLKNHGINMVRIRPTSEPPYNTYTTTTCTGNGCYAETDSADLDLAKRAKQLGMSVELTLFFDGGSSATIPGAWSGHSLSQAESEVYSYVKSEIEAYRVAGVMPDMVTIGNEVDTGFFGSLGSPTGSDFGPFAALETQGMQAIADASSDPSLGPALPAPIRCIHITPAWDLTSFFRYVNSNSISYDAMCQSYYPFFHGPLTSAQAAASNPDKQSVEETVLTNAANSIGKPIFLIELGEHYENGFDANDPWYPATVAGQRQFLMDVNEVMKGLPNNLGMGMEYWDPVGVNIPKTSGGFTNGDGLIDAIYTWNGLTLFDNADTSGATMVTVSNYAAVLPGVDALGGKLDSTLAYKLVNVGSGQILETDGAMTANGIPLNTTADSVNPSLHQQWKISSNADGYFQIANLDTAAGETVEALDTNGPSSAGSPIVANAAASGAASQEWNIVTSGDGTYAVVNRSSGLVLAASGTASASIQQQSPSATAIDWITTATSMQQWQIVPVHVTGASVATALSFASTTATGNTYGVPIGIVNVNVLDSTGASVLSPSVTVTLTVTGPNSFTSTATAASLNGVVSFDMSSVVPGNSGAYLLTASAPGVVSATTAFTVGKAILTVTAQNATRAYGAANPSFTYSFSGFVNGDPQSVVSGTPVLSSAAIISSAPGNYPIAIQSGSLLAVNYSFMLVAGALFITATPTSTNVSASASTVNPGQSITFTATVASATTLAPSGTVTFDVGNTTLGTAMLNSSGVAVYATASLPPGANSITATYAANADFNASTSSPVIVMEPDFSLAASPGSLTISVGSTGNANLTVTPVGGYEDTVKMSCTTALAGVTCSFSPATYTANGSNTVLTGTVTVSASSSAALILPAIGRNSNQMLFVSGMVLPFSVAFWAGIRRLRSRESAWKRDVMPMLVLLVATVYCTACGGGSNSGSSGQPPKSVTGVVAVTAAGSSGTLTQSANLNLTIQ
jgi:arabinogalactan endo-1,4-beta-galactosidase